MQTVWPLQPSWRWHSLALAAAVLVTACGGGGGDNDDTPTPQPQTRIERIQVIGDSLSDSGVAQGLPGYGRTFTIQQTESEPYTIWTEQLAQWYGLAPLCPVYRFNGVDFSLNATPGCTSYAVGGARINNALNAGGQQSPQALLRQMQDLQARGLQATDLVLVDGGGNDAADLATAFLLSPLQLGEDLRQLARSLLSHAEIEAALLDDGLDGLGEAYMERLADTLFEQISTHILAGSEARVLLLNMPDVTQTPRFTSALARVEALLGTGMRRQLEARVRDWVSDFNERLEERARGHARVTVADFEARLNALIDDPGRYGLSNVEVPACEPGFTDGQGNTVALDFEHCTASALSAITPPAPVSGGSRWWSTYLFADSFHPTPYGHQLMAELAQENLRARGWNP